MASVVARDSNALRARAGARTGDFHEVRIRGDLIEYRQEAFGFGQETVVHIRFELHESVVDSEAVKFGLTL